MTATTTLILIGVPLVLLLGTLWALQRRWGLDSIGQAATESMSRLLPTPVRTRPSLRRRFVRALTTQRVLMPSGQVVAATSLHLRIAPEDVARLAPDEDLDALAADAATLYARHARRESWQLMGPPRVSIEIDPVLRSGWIPLARINCTSGQADGSGVADLAAATPPEPAGRPAQEPPTQATRAIAVPRAAGDTTCLVPMSDELTGDATVLTAVRTPTLVLSTADKAHSYVVPAPHAVLGRGEQCAVRLAEPSVSRRHARVECRTGRWVVSDLGSSNGTFVADVRLAAGQERELYAGDQLRLGPGSPVLTVSMRD